MGIRVGNIIRIMFVACILFFPFNSNAQESAGNNISIDITPVWRFYDLMLYLESEYDAKFSCGQGTKSELKKIYRQREGDQHLQSLLDSLLASRPYSPDVIRYVKLYGYPGKPKGKEAYKAAFTLLPEYCVSMTAVMPQWWSSFWKSEYRFKTDSILSFMVTNEKEILRKMLQRCTVFLPEDIDWNIKTEVYLTIDGNRGGFQTDNMIIMDILTTKFFNNFSYFQDVLAHELHHVYYGEWLKRQFSVERKKGKNKALLEAQFDFIMEGTAQHLTFHHYPEKVKEMYNNKELIKELFDEWLSFIRKMEGIFPSLQYKIYEGREYNKAVARTEKYYPGKLTIDAYAYRPTTLYYLSYNICHAILQKGGSERLSFVIQHPDKLLAVYNELYDESMLVPSIPENIVMLWQNNF